MFTMVANKERVIPRYCQDCVFGLLENVTIFMHLHWDMTESFIIFLFSFPHPPDLPPACLEVLGS